VVLFGSIHLGHSKTTNAKVAGFLKTYMLNAVSKKLYNFDAW